jgi:hypothetical protein
VLIDVRILRLLRVFRIFKLTSYMSEYRLLGEAIAASGRKIMMLMGWGLLAVPTGIITAEMTAQRFRPRWNSPRSCRACRSVGHEEDAGYCRICGVELAGR